MKLKYIERLSCLFAELVLVVVTSGCGLGTYKCTDVNQDQVHQRYSLRYSASSDETYAYAAMHFRNSGGATLDLGDKCGVQNDKATLGKVYIPVIDTTSYTGYGKGNLLESVFKFTDSTGRHFFNNGATLHSIAFDPVPASISIATGTTIRWSGGRIESTETVTISVMPVDGGKFSTSRGTNEVGVESLTLAPEAFLTATPGSYELQIARWKPVPLQQKTETGGDLKVIFESQRHRFNLVN